MHDGYHRRFTARRQELSRAHGIWLRLCSTFPQGSRCRRGLPFPHPRAAPNTTSPSDSDSSLLSFRLHGWLPHQPPKGRDCLAAHHTHPPPEDGCLHGPSSMTPRASRLVLLAARSRSPAFRSPGNKPGTGHHPGGKRASPFSQDGRQSVQVTRVVICHPGERMRKR